MQRYCIDTHALIWYAISNKKLSNTARMAIQSSLHKKSTIFLPYIALLELHAVCTKKHSIPFDRLYRAIRISSMQLAPMDTHTLDLYFKLSDALEMHDRMIIATAMHHRAKLITHDRKITELYPDLVIW